MASGELPVLIDGFLGAACTLDDPHLRERLRVWRELCGRATIHPTAIGARLVFAPDEDIGAVVDLVADESACCPFYTFTIQIHGRVRELEVSAGPGGGPAVGALLGLDESGAPEP